MAHVQNITCAAPGIAPRIAALWEDFKSAHDLRQRYRTTVNELQSMSDHDLDDIGIARYDIRDIARKHVYGV